MVLDHGVHALAPRVRFEHPAQHIVLAEYLHAILDAEVAAGPLDQTVKSWLRMVDGTGGRGLCRPARCRFMSP